MADYGAIESVDDGFRKKERRVGRRILVAWPLLELTVGLVGLCVATKCGWVWFESDIIQGGGSGSYSHGEMTVLLESNSPIALCYRQANSRAWCVLLCWRQAQ